MIHLPVTPETIRASKEWEHARARAEKRIKKSEISESELRAAETLNYVVDQEVLATVHNILKAAWNATHPEDDPINIKFRFK